MSVPFRFDTVLRIRETERDVCLQAFAVEQSRATTLRAERGLIADERLRAFDELRTLQEGGSWTAEQAVAHQQHLEQLALRLIEAEAALSEATTQVTLRRQELLEADFAVKALDKLAERHHVDQSRLTQAKEERDRDDTRRPGRAA